MEGAKPIEPGCQAIVIRGMDAWKKVVYVGQFVGHRPSMKSSERDIWEIDREINWVHTEQKRVVPLKLAPENALMRIDDPGDDKQEEKHNDRKSGDKRPAGTDTCSTERAG